MDFDSIFQLDSPEEKFRYPDVMTLSQPAGAHGQKIGESVVRVDKVRLEQQYLQNPIVFNIVTKYIQGIGQYTAQFWSPDQDETELLKEYSTAFRLNTYLVPKIVQDLVVFGSHWSEKIPSTEPLQGSNHKRLHALDVRDSKYMDISKWGYHMSSFPIVDQVGQPAYYVQYLNPLQNPREGEEERIVVQLGRRAIKFPIEEILHITLYTLGDSYEGLGLVESMYQASLNHMQVEQATTQAIKRLGYPLPIATVGNERVYPTKQTIDEVTEALKNLNEKSGITLPEYVKVSLLQSSNPDKLTENLDYYVNQVIAGGGLPGELVTGVGGGANKHTLQELMTFAGGTFNMIKTNIAESFENQVLKDIAKSEGITNRLRFKWVKKTEEDDALRTD